ncbi:MAG: dolichyl-phosphate beta-glucosyltransferase [Pseudomonadota bacterium]
MKNTELPSVTIVVPVYNEQERIASSLYDIKDYLEKQDYPSNVMVIDDGSSDMTTEVVKFVDIYGSEFNSQNVGVLEENVKNVGKGYSIAKGLLKAEGDIIVFTDADCSTPITEIGKLLEKIYEGYDVVIGSRHLKDSEVSGRGLGRSVMSRSFNFIARFAQLLEVKDSQCGFKAYTRDAARMIAAKQKTYGFCFDVEHLHIARKLGCKVTEVAVEWTHDTRSTVSPVSDSIAMLIELLKIRIIHRNL